METISSEVKTSGVRVSDVAYLNNLYKDLKTKSLKSITNYLENRIETRSFSSNENLLGLRSSTSNSDYQQMIVEEYVDPYFVESIVDETATIEYTGDFDFQALINDSRLSVSDREEILLIYANLEYYLSEDPMPFGPDDASDSAYCASKYQRELFHIATYYFSANFLTIAPLIKDFMANAWNRMVGMKLVSNNHYAVLFAYLTKRILNKDSILPEKKIRYIVFLSCYFYFPMIIYWVVITQFSWFFLLYFSIIILCGLAYIIYTVKKIVHDEYIDNAKKTFYILVSSVK